MGWGAGISEKRTLFAVPGVVQSGLYRLLVLLGVSCLSLVIPPAAAAQGEGDGFNCVMDPAQLIRLSSSGSGVLSEIHVSRGDFVQAEQSVAQMESSLEQATLAILEARARSNAQVQAQEARAEFVLAQLDRMERMVEQNTQSAVRLEEMEYEYVLAQIQLEQARIERDVQQAEVERARLANEKTVIRSPINGYVVDIPLGPGEGTGPDRPVMTIAQLDPLHVEAFLPIDLFAQVAPGMAVTVQPEAPVGGSYKAHITSVDRVFDPASRTFGVLVSLPNPQSLLPAGHRCRLTLSFAG